MAKKLSDKQKLRNFYNEFLASVEPSAAPACRHFGDCGGCEFQNIPYPAQVEAKRQAFRFVADVVSGEYADKATVAADAGDADQAAMWQAKADALAEALRAVDLAATPSPKPYGYRQRMDYVFAFDKAGLRRANRHRQVVEVEECPLLGDEGYRVFHKALGMAREFHLESYDYLRHHGDLRYFVVRRTRSGDVLLSLVTKTVDHEREVMDILTRMVASGDIVAGYWLLAEGLGDVSFGPVRGTVGAQHIVETMNGIKLAIGPNTFFQSNPSVAEQAYAAIADFVRPDDTVLDLYSGVASIAITAATKAKAATAVENVPDNVTLARINLRDNAVDNLTLVEEDSAAYLHTLAAAVQAGQAAAPDMLVINPPRPGVEGDGMAAIKRLAPQRIAYLSCNPFSLLRNLADIVDSYRIVSLTVYDMFPQTRHFESLALLEKV